MLKKLALILALAIPTEAVAETMRWDVRGDATLGLVADSCHATKRMMRDRHRISYKDGKLYVNGLRWKIDDSFDDPTGLPGWIFATFHAENGQHTRLTLELYTNSRGRLEGSYTLYGLDSKRRMCMDRIRVVGTEI